MLCGLLFVTGNAFKEEGDSEPEASSLLREVMSQARKLGQKKVNVYVLGDFDNATVFDGLRHAIQDNLDLTLTIFVWKDGIPKLKDCDVIVACDKTFRQSKISEQLPNEVKASVKKYICSQ